VLLHVRGKDASATVGFRGVESGSRAAIGGDLHGRILELLKSRFSIGSMSIDLSS
jgi:hypothetical protein